MWKEINMNEQKNENSVIDQYKILKYSHLDLWFLRNDSLPWVGHTPFGRMLVAELKPGVLVELGTHWGNSYFTFCQSVLEFSLNTKCYSVDSWEGDTQAGYYDDEIFLYVNKINGENFDSFSTLKRMSFNDALQEFEDNSIDLLHIDGFHSYKAVREDFYNWLPKVRVGGIILFHDANEFQDGFGVAHLWNEIKHEADGTHLFRHSHGLGVWRKPGGGPLQSDILSTLLQENSAEAQLIDSFCTALGESQRQRAMLIVKGQSLAEKQRELLLLKDQNSKFMNLAQDYSSLSELYNNIYFEYNKILASKSWKFTMPLRSLMGYIRKLFYR